VGERTERIQPKGVFAVSILTAFCALVFFCLAFVYYELHFSPLLHPDLRETIVGIAVTGGLGVLFLADSILVFLGKREGWYLSIALWIILSSGLSILFYRNVFMLLTSGLLFASPILYPAISLIHFLKKSVRRYFGVQRAQSPLARGS
jgi:Na+/melibiose symporter-like transporter